MPVSRPPPRSCARSAYRSGPCAEIDVLVGGGGYDARASEGRIDLNKIYRYDDTSPRLTDESVKREERQVLADDIGADLSRIGISGSPTKVKKVENVVLSGRYLTLFNADDVGVRDLINELIDERTFG